MRFHVKRLLWAAMVFCSPARAGGENAVIPAQGLELVGRLYAPEGKGPFPAVVLLHGCNGMWGSDGEPSRSYEAWARHFQGRGYLALLLDSFGPRGEKEICTQGARKIHPGRDRAGDANAALRWLALRSDVRPESIHLLGWSNGATSVLEAIKGPVRAGPEATPSFRTAIAFYPGCNELAQRNYESRVPLLIQAGGADDWTPARYCEALAAQARASGSPVEIDVYEGAHHAFDAAEGRVRSTWNQGWVLRPVSRRIHLSPRGAPRGVLHPHPWTIPSALRSSSSAADMPVRRPR